MEGPFSLSNALLGNIVKLPPGCQGLWGIPTGNYCVDAAKRTGQHGLVDVLGSEVSSIGPGAGKVDCTVKVT